MYKEKGRKRRLEEIKGSLNENSESQENRMGSEEGYVLTSL